MDQRTLAYINMHAILGTLENLCELDPEARALMTNDKPISLGFDVKGGPQTTLTFRNGRVRLDRGVENANVRLVLGSCEKFNQMVAGEAQPIPVPGSGFRPAHLKFLLGDFQALTARLESYLRASEEDLLNSVFFETSTKLMLYVISVALSQIADYDEIGRFSAKYLPDGEIQMSIKNTDIATTIRVRNNVLATIKQKPAKPSAIMEFESLELARALFDGKVNALSCIGDGRIVMGGKIAMLDVLNRLLDRVPLYLSN